MSTMGYVTTLTGAEDSASISLDFEKQSYKVMEGGKQVSKSFDDIFTLTRSTIGGRVNEKGVYEMVAVNKPRFDYDPVTKLLKGLLVEEQRVNLLPSSQPYTLGMFSKSGDVTFKPTGLLGAGMQFGGVFPAGTATGVSYCYSQSIQATVSTTYTFSVFVRYADGRKPKFGAMASTNSPLNDFVMILDGSGRLPDTYVITDFGNGLYRFSVTAPSQPTQAVRGFGIIRYAGQGAADSPELMVTGYQLEQAGSASSYIPTTTTFTSRSSTATYFDSKGVLRTAGVNIARSSAYIYDQSNKLIPVGLLLETSSTNLIRLSTDLSLTPWSRTQTSCVLSDGGSAPDGTVAQMFTMVGTTGHNITHSLQSALVVGTTYTLSVWLRSPNWGNKQFQLAYYDSGVVQVGTGGSVTPTAEWKRYEYTFAPTAVAAAPQIRLVGYSNGVDGDIVEIFGPQLETGVIATSYIPTAATFTGRSSTATYLDNQGLIQTAASGVGRSNTYRYDSSGVLRDNGLLLESSSANLLTYAEDYSGWVNTGPGGTTPLILTAAQSSGPRGANTMTLVSRADLTARYLSKSFTGTTNQTVSFSQYAKASDLGGFLSFRIQCSYPIRVDAWFNLLTGECGTNKNGDVTVVSVSMTKAANGSWLCKLTATSGTSPWLSLALTPSTGPFQTDSNAGDLSSVYLDCSQLEVGALSTSYIPTTNSIVSRATDVFTTATTTRASDLYKSVATTRGYDSPYVADVASWWNPLEGTTDVTFTPGVPGTGNTAVGFYMRNIASIGNDVVASRLNVNGTVAFVGTDSNGAATVSINANGTYAPYQRIRAVSALKKDNYAFSVNGTAAVTDLLGNMPQPQHLRIGNNGSNSQNTNGHINKFNYYPVRLANSQIESLSN